MGIDDIEKFCVLGEAEKRMLEQAYRKLDLSVRTYHRILKVSRTIADLDEQELIHTNHISEALSFRMLDRQ